MKRDRNRNIRKSWMAAMLGMLLTLMCAGTLSAAPVVYTAPDASQPVTLTVNADYGENKISGLRLTLYRAGEIAVTPSGTIDFTLTQPFAEYGDKLEMNVNQMDSSAWAKGAKTAAGYVLSDSVEGRKQFDTVSAATNEYGVAVFTDMKQGLYLMTGSYEGSTYGSVYVTPVFLTLPQWKDGSGWNYQAVVTAKTDVTPIEETPKKTSVSVRKVWSGDDSADQSSKRPDSITVELRDGEGNKVDTKTLSAANGWAFTWTGLNEGQWGVTEADIPDGYSVSIEEQATQDGKNVTITNTTPAGGVKGESRERDKESESEIELDKTGKKPKKKSGGEVKGSSRQGDTGSTVSATKLPQTGQLWWPVWVLAGAAAVLVIIGLFLRMSGKRDLKDR